MNHESPGLQVVVRARKAGDALRIHAVGELDLASVDVLREALDGALEAGRGDVEVEMSDMTFCDSTGLCLLLSIQRRFHAAGRQLRLLDPGPAVARLLDLSSTRQLFDVRTTSSIPDTHRRDPARV